MIAALATEPIIVSKLLNDGTFTPLGLEKARREAELVGLPLIEVMLIKDTISDADVAQIYAEANGLRFLDLSRRSPTKAWTLTLPENIAQRKNCLVFGEVAGQLVVAVADPVDASVRTAVANCYDRPIQYVVSPRYQIRELIDDIYGQARAQGARSRMAMPLERAKQTSSSTGLNMVEQIDSIIDEAVDRRASDIHLEPEEDRVRVRLRIDGRMIEARSYPLDTASAMISRVKVLATLDITERRKPQDGRFSHRSFDQELDIRVAVIPTIRGERITLRLLSADRSRLTLENLGMGLELRQAFERLLTKPHGIILITGPTGSGKTTTLYAGLQLINSPDKHIITIEDPVEYKIPGINQIPVDSEHGISFAKTLRSILRHDPDVVMVGEIRDEETAHLALEASLTGHLVFATLHTNSAVGALTRLLDMGCEPYLLASGVIGVMAQRLVRKICTNCRTARNANPAERKMMGIPDDRRNVEVFWGTGCTRCLRSGYYDRVGVFEFVPFDAGLSEMVMNSVSTQEMERYAEDNGAITLRRDAITKVRDGLTTLEEALRVTGGD